VDKSSRSDNDVISCRALCKRYGSQVVVANIDLQVETGECVVLVGHNGAGKTTLMKLMLGLTRPTSGTVEVLGSDPARGRAVAKHRTLGYLPESVAFYEAMTGRELLIFYARLKGASATDCDRLLHTVELSEASRRRIGTYSKGMRQRLGLAQAMLGDPRLLFLDEPTTGLDPSLRHHFYDVIDSLHKEGVTSLISSHALNEVEARADRFVIMKNGRIIASGSLDELYQQATLRTRMRILAKPGTANRIAERLGSNVRIGEINHHSLSLSCINGEKMPLIRRITALGDDVRDMQIMPPRLDEVYRFFMNRDPE
jgi:Cu-processing system ATP-binding protein